MLVPCIAILFGACWKIHKDHGTVPATNERRNILNSIRKIIFNPGPFSSELCLAYKTFCFMNPWRREEIPPRRPGPFVPTHGPKIHGSPLLIAIRSQWCSGAPYLQLDFAPPPWCFKNPTLPNSGWYTPHLLFVLGGLSQFQCLTTMVSGSYPQDLLQIAFGLYIGLALRTY